VPGRDQRATPSDVNVIPASVPDISRALSEARARERVTPTAAAHRAGITEPDVDALESGDARRMDDRVATLRQLRTYANSLGLPGDEFVLALVTSWPSEPIEPSGRGDTGVVPVVTMSSAPALRHTSVGGQAPLGSDATGVTDATITGVVASVASLGLSETGQVMAVDTGEVRIVGAATPVLLRALVIVVALLVLLGGAALIEHTHVTGWYDSAQRSTTHAVDRVKSALGLSHGTTTTPTQHHGTTTTTVPLVDIVGRTATTTTFNIHAKSFTVKVVAFERPCWVKIVNVGQAKPVYEQVLPAGGVELVTVTKSTTVETAASSGRVYVYEGSKFISFYFPLHTPFTLTFNALG
jgi:hypothetical protein